MLKAREIVASSNLLESDKSDTLILLIAHETSLIKIDSSLLFFAMECLNETIFSSIISIKTASGAWSKESHKSGCME